ncbi:hypothetical protein FGO68_gene6084 [Halteria grandinella]|uniref:Uncharacterized protein n=1 Tax=Halteria grandinella TaxID=5974 RepID=A0A8J8T2C1_HALGN|nr:hypothetical protein FGO68_gene6084 [Halteria grandinella]
MLCQTVQLVTNTALLGHQENPKDLLAALGLGTLTINIAAFSVVYTFNNSLMTLVSQAFGLKDYRLSALYVNRQVILAILLYLPQALLLFRFSEPIFLSLGIPNDIAFTATTYVKVVMIGHLFLNISNCYQKYLSAQREVRLQMGSYLIEFVFHIVLAFVLTTKYQMGVLGIALVTCLDYVLRFVVLQLFIYHSRFQENLISYFDPDSWTNLGPQLLLSLKSLLMGYWLHRSYQMFSVITLFMSSDVIAAQHICISIISIFHVIPISLSMAFSVLVGNMIGASQIKEAKAYVKFGLTSGILWGIFCALVLTLFRPQIIATFSKSESVNADVAQSYHMLTAYLLVEPMSKIMTGIVTGLGKQGVASIFTLIGYWVIGIPLTLISVFNYQGGLYGIWLGASVSILFIFSACYVMMKRSNYELLAKQARERRQREIHQNNKNDQNSNLANLQVRMISSL